MFDVGELDGAALGHCYPEFAGYAGKCRFTSCLHGHEPGCAVKEAVERGKIDKNRYERYLRIKKALEERV
jgi:ribosome biogenesis GTPase